MFDKMLTIKVMDEHSQTKQNIDAKNDISDSLIMDHEPEKELQEKMALTERGLLVTDGNLETDAPLVTEQNLLDNDKELGLDAVNLSEVIVEEADNDAI